jgi:membrane fusion protein, multidrug efflux system
LACRVNIKRDSIVKHFISLILCAAIIGGGVFVVYIASMVAPKKSEAAEQAPPAKVPNVHIQVLESTTINDVVPLTGRLEPWEHVVISSEAVGKVEWRGVEENQKVTQGQELYRIDTTAVQTVHDQAAARHKLTLQEVDRAQHLQEKGASSPQNLDRASTERDVAAADLNAVKLRLEKSVVKAPFDGVIDKLFKKQGEFTDMGAPLVVVIQVTKVKVVVGVPERDISHFSVGNKVPVELDAFQGKTFEGIIHRIAASGDVLTHTFGTEIELPNPNELLRPGMTARVKLVRQSFPNAVAVPIFSVIPMENQRFAIVEESGVARVRLIETGVLQGSLVQVTKGLQAGEHLIVAGQRDVRDGEKVHVMPGTPQ